MRLNVLFAIVFVAVFAGCQQNQENGERKPEKAESEAKAEVSNSIALPELETMTEFPEEVRGCSCYFSRNEADFKAGKYIYLSNYTNLSIISVNGQLLRLNRNNQPDSTATLNNSVYANPDYELQIRLDATNQNGDETNWLQGKLILTSLKTKQSKTVPFVGECGC